jgi:pimeloyl-ACP methyl ester carboxylesterase
MQATSAIHSTSVPTARDLSARPAPPTEAEVLASFRGPPHAFVDVGHSRLAYRRFGSGPDVLFIHGWPLHSGTYRALVPLFAGSFTCHLLDLPGAGQTESDSDAPFDTLSQAATVRRAIDALGLERYALVGQDSGGFIARLVAVDPRAAALVLANTEIPGHRSFALRLFTLAMKAGGIDMTLRLLRFRFVRELSTLFGGSFFDLRHIEGEFHELFIEPLLTSPDRRRRSVRAVAGFDFEAMDRLDATHANIHCPSLFIWGTEDPFFPLAPARAMLTQLAGGARLVEIPRAKLLVYEEHPQAFAEHALPFLRGAFRVS